MLCVTMVPEHFAEIARGERHWEDLCFMVGIEAPEEILIFDSGEE